MADAAEALVLRGPSQTGKSTFMNMAPRLHGIAAQTWPAVSPPRFSFFHFFSTRLSKHLYLCTPTLAEVLLDGAARGVAVATGDGSGESVTHDVATRQTSIGLVADGRRQRLHDALHRRGGRDALCGGGGGPQCPAAEVLGL